MKKTMALLMAVCMLLTLTACSQKTKRKPGKRPQWLTEETTEKQEPTEKKTPFATFSEAWDEITQETVENIAPKNSGNVVAGPEGVFYWKYRVDSFDASSQILSGRGSLNGEAENSLVCRLPDGTEKEILRTAGNGPLALAGDGIYYTESRENRIRSCSFSGLEGRSYDACGQIVWCDPESGTLLLRNSRELSALNLKSGQVRELEGDAFLGCADGEAWLGRNGQDALTVSAYSFRENECRTVLTIPRQDSGEFLTKVCIADGRIYCGVGCVAGTGMIFQGGRAVSAPLTGAELRSEGDLPAGGFLVEEDGTVSTSGPTTWSTYVREEDRSFIEDQGTVYRTGLENGQPEPLFLPEDFESLNLGSLGAEDNRILSVRWAEKSGPDAWALLMCSESDDLSMVNPTYQLKRVLMIHKNTETGASQIIYDTENPAESTSEDLWEEVAENFRGKPGKAEQTDGSGKKKNSKIPEDAVEFNGHFYQLFVFHDQELPADTEERWNLIVNLLDTADSYPAVISSREENDFLLDYMRSCGVKSAYFGLTDRETEGRWQWCRDEGGNYSNWHENEPNGQNSSEDYAMFYEKYEDGTWNDGDLSHDVPILCEWDHR